MWVVEHQGNVMYLLFCITIIDLDILPKKISVCKDIQSMKNIIQYIKLFSIKRIKAKLSIIKRLSNFPRHFSAVD